MAEPETEIEKKLDRLEKAVQAIADELSFTASRNVRKIFSEEDEEDNAA